MPSQAEETQRPFLAVTGLNSSILRPGDLILLGLSGGWGHYAVAGSLGPFRAITSNAGDHAMLGLNLSLCTCKVPLASNCLPDPYIYI